MKSIQPVLIYPIGHGKSIVPMQPIQDMLAEGQRWYSAWLSNWIVNGQSLWLNMKPLIVTYGPLSIAQFRGPQSNTGQAVRDTIISIGMIDTPDWLYLTMVRGIGAWAGTFTQQGNAGLSIVSDAAIESICGEPRPNTMDIEHPDWGEDTKGRDGQTGTVFHEVLHGLMMNKDSALWGPDADGNSYGHSKPGLELLSGDWHKWPKCGLDPREVQIIKDNGWV